MTGLPITASRVVAVLLADGWHHISPGTFTVGTLTFGADGADGGLGYHFEEAKAGNLYGPVTLAGPLSAVLAVRQVATGRRRSSHHTADHVAGASGRAAADRRSPGDHGSSPLSIAGDRSAHRQAQAVVPITEVAPRVERMR